MDKTKPDAARKKELLEAYKHRKPPMGVIALTCLETGEAFLGASKDTQADFNSVCFKLTAGGFPNRRLQQLWNQYGRQGFALTVLKPLEHKEGQDDAARLEQLRQACLEQDPKASKIWR